VNFETHLQLRMALRWCCSIDSPDYSDLEQSRFILRFLHDLATRPGAHWNEMGLFLGWTQAMVKSQRWCWPLLLSEVFISTILLLTQRPKEPQDWVNEPYGQGATLVLGMQILKRLSTEEVHVEEIRRLRGPDLLTTLLAKWVCESDVTRNLSDAWLSTHLMMCMGNLALSCGRPFSRPLTPPAYGGWPAPLIWRAVETVMRVMLQTQP